MFGIEQRLGLQGVVLRVGARQVGEAMEVITEVSDHNQQHNDCASRPHVSANWTLRNCQRRPKAASRRQGLAISVSKDSNRPNDSPD